jgi:putative redox protein
VPTKPPVLAELAWKGHLQFEATSAGIAVTLDGDSKAGPSPVQALAFALAGCMATDVVHILARGHHRLRAFHVRLTAQRAQEAPHRFVAVVLALTLQGDVPRDAIDRAVELSRDRYCSVWHSLSRDIDLRITVETST